MVQVACGRPMCWQHDSCSWRAMVGDALSGSRHRRAAPELPMCSRPRSHTPQPMQMESRDTRVAALRRAPIMIRCWPTAMPGMSQQPAIRVMAWSRSGWIGTVLSLLYPMPTQQPSRVEGRHAVQVACGCRMCLQHDSCSWRAMVGDTFTGSSHRRAALVLATCSRPRSHAPQPLQIEPWDTCVAPQGIPSPAAPWPHWLG